MPLRFDQLPMEDGIYAMVIDNGHDIWHVFTECERWSTVREAMSTCANAYASEVWERKASAEVSE